MRVLFMLFEPLYVNDVKIMWVDVHFYCLFLMICYICDI